MNLAESFVDNATVDVSKLTSSYKINLSRSVCKTGKLCCPKAQLVLKGFEIDLLSFDSAFEIVRPISVVRKLYGSYLRKDKTNFKR